MANVRPTERAALVIGSLLAKLEREHGDNIESYYEIMIHSSPSPGIDLDLPPSEQPIVKQVKRIRRAKEKARAASRGQ